jgi:hypothetical protein
VAAPALGAPRASCPLCALSVRLVSLLADLAAQATRSPRRARSCRGSSCPGSSARVVPAVRDAPAFGIPACGARGAVKRRRRVLHTDRRRGRVVAAPAPGAPRARYARVRDAVEFGRGLLIRSQGGGGSGGILSERDGGCRGGDASDEGDGGGVSVQLRRQFEGRR